MTLGTCRELATRSKGPKGGQGHHAGEALREGQPARLRDSEWLPAARSSSPSQELAASPAVRHLGLCHIGVPITMPDKAHV